MNKTEMMKKFEEETGLADEFGAMIQSVRNCEPLNEDYVAWLEAKASACDRLMSGGKKTPKEWANIFGVSLAKDMDGSWWAYEKKPILTKMFDTIWNNISGGCAFKFPSWIWKDFDYDGDWLSSLTLPDGWEEK